MKSTVLIILSTIIGLQSFSQGTGKNNFTLTINHLNDSAGIQFNHENTWEELLQKAKIENKLIYVDAFTTWCGPCKWMSGNVYNTKEVGDIYNASFISFKAQIDTGKNDNGYVQSHYADFKNIAAKYNVEGYPTHLFINGDGELIHKALGRMDVEQFIGLSKDALNPDKQFGTLKKKFETGDRSAELLFKLAGAASGAYELELAAQAIDLYIPTQKNFFTKENIELLFSIRPSVKGKSFELIKNNVKQINSVMGENKAEEKIREIVLSTVVYPEVYSNSANPDFNKIHAAVEKVMNKKYADEMTDYVSIKLMNSKKDWTGLAKSITVYTKKYGTKNFSSSELNGYAWNVFENVNDKSVLEKALQWALLSVEKLSYAANNDTAANLYFKLGEKARAIEYGQKALDMARKEGGDVTDYEKSLEKFKGK